MINILNKKKFSLNKRLNKKNKISRDKSNILKVRYEEVNQIYFNKKQLIILNKKTKSNKLKIENYFHFQNNT